MDFNLDLKDKIIDNEKLRWVEIYKITNNITNKIYIGQAVSHIRKKNKLLPHGTNGRFKSHIREALGNNNVKYTCKYLDDSIKKHGSTSFTTNVLQICSQDDANRIESEWIIQLNSLAPNGYNLTTNCRSFCPSIDFRKSISCGLINALEDKRFERIKKYSISLNEDLDKYVTPKNRNAIQVGWRIRLKDIIKTDEKIPPNKELEFTSQLISLDENKIRAIEFLKIVKESLNSNTFKLTGTP
jgi:hypothetical protein